MGWNDERVDLLKKLWSEGLSASQVSFRLGYVTRNAVIGKLHRLGLTGKSPTVRKRTVRRTYAQIERPKIERRLDAIKHPPVEFDAEPLPSPTDPLAGAALVSFENLEQHHCRWMHGKLYCGRDQVPGLSYCQDHARVAYRPFQVTPRTAFDLPAVLRDRIIDRVTA